MYSRGFVENYFKWVYQGESDDQYNAALERAVLYQGSSSNAILNLEEDRDERQQEYGQMQHMIYEGTFNHTQDDNQTILEEEEEMNPEAQRMYHMLESTSMPLYPGCDVSQLAAATELLNIKSAYHIPERGFN